MSLVCCGQAKKIFTALKILDSLVIRGVSPPWGGFTNRVMVSLAAVIKRFIFSSRAVLAGLQVSILLPVR
jgi:hypothetical protein